MALTVEQLAKARDDLMVARAQGVRSVRDQNGETVEYKTDREMAAALAALDRLIAELSGRKSPRTFLFRTSKGV